MEGHPEPQQMPFPSTDFFHATQPRCKQEKYIAVELLNVFVREQKDKTISHKITEPERNDKKITPIFSAFHSSHLIPAAFFFLMTRHAPVQ